MVVGQLRFRCPHDAADIGSGRKPAARHAANVIDEHVVILGAALLIGHDALEDFKDGQRLHLEPCLFADLASRRVFEQFAGLDDTARKRPLALQRLASAFDEQNPTVVIKDEGADAEERAVRVAPANTAPIL
jgi:hypothetical protein